MRHSDSQRGRVSAIIIVLPPSWHKTASASSAKFQRVQQCLNFREHDFSMCTLLLATSMITSVATQLFTSQTVCAILRVDSRRCVCEIAAISPHIGLSQIQSLALAISICLLLSLSSLYFSLSFVHTLDCCNELQGQPIFVLHTRSTLPGDAFKAAKKAGSRESGSSTSNLGACPGHLTNHEDCYLLINHKPESRGRTRQSHMSNHLLIELVTSSILMTR